MLKRSQSTRLDDWFESDERDAKITDHPTASDLEFIDNSPVVDRGVPIADTDDDVVFVKQVKPKSEPKPGRGYCDYVFTLNNPDIERKLKLDTWIDRNVAPDPAGWCIYALERGIQGTPHLQGFFHLGGRIGWTKALKSAVPWWIQPKARYSTYDNQVAYITKDGPVLREVGTQPAEAYDARSQAGSAASQLLFESFRTMAKAGRIDEIRADYHVRYYMTWERLWKASMPIGRDWDHVRGIWLYGAAGTGKSQWCINHCPQAFTKQCTKWWDTYAGQKYVVMEDLGKAEAKELLYLLKIWADKNHCDGQTKGGTLHLDYEYFIVTSNYSIEELYPDLQESDPLKRRFTEKMFLQQTSTRAWPKPNLEEIELKRIQQQAQADETDEDTEDPS